MNEDGYQGRRVTVGRDPTRRRVLFLGDSCTTAGPDGYPDRVIEILQGAGIGAEALIAGVGGYSTFQGLDFLKESLRYRPDEIVAYFGWNDHWLAGAGQPDNEFRPLSPFQLCCSAAYSGSGRADRASAPTADW